MRIALIIPTCDASRHWKALHDGIRRQSLAPNHVVVIDSSSRDDTVALARAAGFTVLPIARRDFNHGGSRQAAAACVPDADLLIYLTQDAIPSGTESFRRVVEAFRDPAIGAAYGRQLPRAHATAIEAHARQFNYPPVSKVRSWECRNSMGFKSIFFSNAFGAYRRNALMGVGGFARDIIFGEDTVAVARLHRAGWKTAYVADALVEHSHNLSVPEELKRYFDIGVLHRRESWLLEQFGAVSGEGRRYILSELGYLWQHDPLSIPSAILRTFAKYVGYQAGRHEGNVAPWLKRYMSINTNYWIERRSQ